jgi:hypothetical protein
MRQIVEEKNHLREAGIYDDEEEEVDDAAPLINQTMGDESEDIAATTAEEVVAMPPVDKADEQGDMATDEDLPVSVMQWSYSDRHRLRCLCSTW